jgi:CRISPR-associated protein Csd1
MILQALYEYYQRKNADSDAAQHLPAFGMEDKEIPFVVELQSDGKPLGIVDMRRQEGKKKIARSFLVPKGVKRSSGIAANLLWDNAEYALGVPTVIVKKGKETLKTKPERFPQQHEAFMCRIADLPQDDEGVIAITRFFQNYGYQALTQDPSWEEIRTTNPNVSFRLRGDSGLVCQRPKVAASFKVSDDDA